jgi:hypothetical protein
LVAAAALLETVIGAGILLAGRTAAWAAPASAATNAPAASVKLTGITTLSGNKRALLVIQEAAPPGQSRPSPRSAILSQGQSEGAVEVLQIDEQTGHVSIRNSGRVMELSLARDGLALPDPAPAAPAPLPAVPALPPPAPTKPTAAAEAEPAPEFNPEVPLTEPIVIGRRPRHDLPRRPGLLRAPADIPAAPIRPPPGGVALQPLPIAPPAAGLAPARQLEYLPQPAASESPPQRLAASPFAVPEQPGPVPSPIDRQPGQSYSASSGTASRSLERPLPNPFPAGRPADLPPAAHP